MTFAAYQINWAGKAHEVKLRVGWNNKQKTITTNLTLSSSKSIDFTNFT